MNRRGNIGDAFTIIGLIFMVGFIAVLAVYLGGKVNDGLQDAPIPESAKTMTGNVNDDIPEAVDFILIMVFLGLPVLSMILAFFNNIHPIFFYVSVAILVLVIMSGYAYQQLWESFTAGEFSNTADSLPMSNFILSNFGVYSLLCGVLILYGSYVKTQSQGGYYQ